MEAGLGLFALRGYHETSVEDVVATARTSKSAFYEFFESKEDCFLQLLEQEGGEIIHQVTAAAAQGRDHRDRIRRGIRAFVHACDSRAPVARVLLVESVGLSPRIEEVRHHLQGRFVHIVEEEARRARPDDTFYAAFDPVVFGRALVGGVNEAAEYLLTRHDTDAEALAHDLCLIFAPDR